MNGPVERILQETDLKRQLHIAVTAIDTALEVITHESVRSLHTISDDVHAILLWLRILLILFVVWYALRLLVWMRGVLVVGLRTVPEVKVSTAVTQPVAEGGDARKQKGKLAE